MDKKFREKIERNRDKDFGEEKKPVFKKNNNKPKTSMFEMVFEGDDAVQQILTKIGDDIPELRDFVDAIYMDLTIENWFDEMIYAAARYLAECAPCLQTKQNIHTKFTVSVNGFSVRFENNIGLDLHAKYEIVNGKAEIIAATGVITTYGKVSREAYITLTREGSEWSRKEKFVKKNNFKKYPKEEREVSEY